jgi:hypothetical protein
MLDSLDGESEPPPAAGHAADSIHACLRDLAIVQERLAALRTAELKAMDYARYLESPEWLETRARVLILAGRRCQVCNAGDVTLNVHHRTYERRGHEADGDLIVLCAGCHGLFHQARKLAPGLPGTPPR